MKNPKRKEKPKVIDYRTENLFFGKPIFDEWIPEKVTNEVLPIYKGDAMVGEIQIGSDGFIEAIFFVKNGLVKLKRMPSDRKLYIGDW